MANTWSTQQNEIFDWFELKTPRHANAHPIASNLVVRARAGTGKTTTIIEGVNRAPESNILLAAFNKRIAEELATRLSNPGAIAKTLHSVGFACVRQFRDRIRLENKDTGPSRADWLTHQVTGATVPDQIKRLISKLHTRARESAPHAKKVGDLALMVVDQECLPDEQWVRAGYGPEYIEKKALDAMEIAASEPAITGIDFSDMIFLPVRNRWLLPTYDLVVVDEAQDMTMAQLEIAQGVSNGRMCVVGDDRQAIYGFRGADSNSIDRLKRELEARELGLTVTYRCGRSIVAEAAQLVPDFEAHHTNPDGLITDLHTSKLGDAAELGDFILSRLNAPLVSTALGLLKRGKRARIAGRDIGAGLKNLVDRLAKGPAAASVPKFLERLDLWRQKEVARMEALNRVDKIDAINDKVEMLVALAEDARSVNEIKTKADSLFTDNGLGQAGVITCSSVHRAKGLEANRVFVLKDTLYPRKKVTIEEDNIKYVAITRAKQHLVWVSDAVVPEEGAHA